MELNSQQFVGSLSSAMAIVARDAESAVADLARMIQVDTTFPPGQGYDAFADLIETLVRPLGFSAERVVVPETLWHVPGGPACGRRTNLVAKRGRGKPVCGLYFHVDTVPAAPGWQQNPLQLTRDGDQLIGLGADPAAVASLRRAGDGNGPCVSSLSSTVAISEGVRCTR